MRRVEVKLVRHRVEPSLDLQVDRALKIQTMFPRLTHSPKEEFWVVGLDGAGRTQIRYQVSVGTATASLVHPREVFAPLILSNSCSAILVHNHPSGVPNPSAADRALTQRLSAAGKLLGIKILDHVILGANRYHSFLEVGEL